MTFASLPESVAFVSSLPGPLHEVRAATVLADELVDGQWYASVEACQEAGLPGWDPEMVADLELVS